MVTRAIWIEPLLNMTLSTTVNALSRVQSIFPALKTIYSDRGTNFIGARREISEGKELWNREQINDKLCEKNIEWQLGPANCGHYGGMWERMVAIVKDSLKASMRNKSLTFDEFETLVYAIAAAVNKRPITAVSDDPLDCSALSPSNFLYPYMNNTTGTNIYPPIPMSRSQTRSRWNEIQTILDDWWKKWHAQ